jgi:hypothetical protein
MGGSSSSTPSSTSTNTTGIEREAAERARRHETSADSSSAAAGSGPSSEQAGQARSDQSADQGAGAGGDESDRLTLLAQPPVAGEDVIISSTSTTGFDSGERLDQSAGGTGAAGSSQSSYADAEVGLSESSSGTGTEAGASSSTPSGADEEFLAGADIDWSSPAEWEELEEEAEISAPTGGGQPTDTSSTSAMARPASSTGVRDAAGQSTGSTAADQNTITTGQASMSGHAGEGGQGTQQAAVVGAASGGPTATASDQATVPYGAIPGDGSRECPSDHPIKGNANSMIYHMPGQSSYDGTEPEYCFANEEDAVAAGYRASKARGRIDTGDEHADQTQESGHGRNDHPSGAAGSAATGIAASGASGTATTGERRASLESDADVSTTPPAAVTSRPGTNQPMGLTQDQTQTAGGAASGTAGQTVSSSPTSGTTGSATQGSSAHGGSVRGDGSRNCPDDYPIKGNRNSMIYHMPHQSSYQGTKAEICFATEEDAIAAGYRRRREGGESGSDAHGHQTGSSHGRQSGDHGDSSTATTGAARSDTAASSPDNDQETTGVSSQSQSASVTGERNAPSGSVAGDGTRDCPEGYPIKGNASSMIYHMPGQSAYEVTEPEFCFATEEAATSAGYRAARR